MFFQKQENVSALNNFIKKSNNISTKSPELTNQLEASRGIVNHIVNHNLIWDKNCKFNIKNIGDQLIAYLHGFSGSEEEIESIFVFLYRFLCELEFTIGHSRQWIPELSSLKSKIEESISKKRTPIDSQIIYASYIMPSSILREMINHEYADAIKNLEKNFKDANEINNNINIDLGKKIQEVESIKIRLDEYKTAFNFVGLHKGFDNLVSQKNEEKCRNSWLLTTLALLVIAPVAAASYYAISQLLKGTPINIDYLISAAPVLSLEIVLIYFFRIVLANNRSLKTQIMQLELRKSLCEFIQSYADYTKEIKTKDQSSLEKFENVIFSGIIAEPEKLPSTYDGLEQIGSLIKELRKP